MRNWAHQLSPRQAGLPPQLERFVINLVAPTKTQGRESQNSRLSAPQLERFVINLVATHKNTGSRARTPACRARENGLCQFGHRNVSRRSVTNVLLPGLCCFHPWESCIWSRSTKTRVVRARAPACRARENGLCQFGHRNVSRSRKTNVLLPRLCFHP